MFGDGIRSLCERTEEIARGFCVERNTVIIGYVGDGVGAWWCAVGFFLFW